MSEARTMQRADVDLSAGIWRKCRTKNGHEHVMPLSPQVCELLGSLPNRGAYFFSGESPHVPWSATAVQYHWRKVRREAGLDDVRIHDLRRSCASFLTMHGENLKVVQRVMDHASLAATEIYAHLDMASLRAALCRHSNRLLGS